MIRKASAYAAGLLVTFAATSAFAANFQINVTLRRPALMKKGKSPLRERDPEVNTPDVVWVPASYQLVDIYQDNMFGPQYCGSAFTNAQGTLSGTSFSCGGNLPNQVEIVVRGESLRGFRVGSNSPWPWEQLEVAYAYQWWLPWKPSNRQTTINYGTYNLGGSAANVNDLNFRAAALIDLLDEVYEELNISGTWWYDYSRTPIFQWSNWLINDVIAQTIGSPVPWTYWQTVHLNPGTSTYNVLSAVPHELGHVLYNTRHSDMTHYVGEVPGYAKNHNVCTAYGTPVDSNGSQFAHYEGFAHTVKSLFFRHHAERLGSTEYGQIDPQCGSGQASINYEGNAHEFYSAFMGGQPLVRPVWALYGPTSHRVGANMYTFPATSALFSMVENSRYKENVSQIWTGTLSSQCKPTTAGTPMFCSSRRFRCMVKTSVLAASGGLPSEFTSVNCDPGRSNVVALTKKSNTSFQVDFSPSDLADGYKIVVDAVGMPRSEIAVDVSNKDITRTMWAVVSTPDCKAHPLTISVKTDYGGKTITGLAKTQACP